jgi:putative methionine-R-sulfoxide reductase with GAF domain
MESLGTNPASTGQESDAILANRRKRVRQKVHTPAYASLDEKSSGAILDLSEIVDISEDGMSIQTSSPLQPNQTLNVCLDLSETRNYINTTGQVVWWHGSGRAGIRFPDMAPSSVRELKEWLFANAVAGVVNYQSSRAHDSLPEFPAVSPDSPSPIPEDVTLDLPPDHTTLLAALSAVKREVEALGSDNNAALQLIAERVQSLTKATGAAIALSEGAVMVCRASSGSDAPGLGSGLDVGSGFSGQCVRTGKLLQCEDSEEDPRVDRESCRSLGIRSMLAVPVFWEGQVVGLLEIFAPVPRAFKPSHHLVMERLSEAIATVVQRSRLAARTPQTASELAYTEPSVPFTPPVFSRLFPRILLITAVTIFTVVVLLVAVSWMGSKSSVPTAAATQGPAPLATPSPASAPAPDDLEGLRGLAERGDPAAQFAVGARYATGDGVKQDYTEAVRWFSKAADRGHIVAQATLGAYYWAGRGVPQDLSKAYFWSILAQAGGDEASKYRVAVLTSRMTRTQIIAAQQQANDWLKQHQLASKASPSVAQ